MISLIPATLISNMNNLDNKINNNFSSSLPLIKTTNSISFINSKVVGPLGQEKLIEVGNVSDEKLSSW